MKKLKITLFYKKIMFFLLLFFILIVRIFIVINYKYNLTNISGNYKVLGIRQKDSKIVLDVYNKKKIRLYNSNISNVHYGDWVKIKGNLEVPNNNTVFNLFNLKKYLLSNNIRYICNNCSVKIVKNNNNFIFYLKNNIYKRIEKYKTKEYLYVFLQGDASFLEDNILEKSNFLGISHLFSISGMHLSLFIFFLNKLLKKNKYKKILIFSFCIIFLLLIGFRISLVKSILLYFFSYYNKVFNVKFNSITLLFIVSILFLIFNPFFIYNIGFLFSFIITFFILLLNQKYKNKNYLKKLMYISFISFLASIPILSMNYFKINLLNVFANIIFVPLVSFLVFPFGILTFFIKYLDFFYSILISFFESLINIISKIDFFAINIAKPNFIMIFLYYFFLTLTITKSKKYIILYFLVFIININLRLFINNPIITFFDVNQGDSSTIIYPHGKTILLDTGGLYYSNSNVANRIIQYYNSIGINKIYYLIITHGDYDHMGEAINLVNNFKVEKVIFNCGEYNELEKDLIKVLDKKHIQYYSCIKELNIDKNKLYFLQTKEYDNENDNSNVIYTELNGYKFMFMGDASITTEREIIENYNLPDIDVLKVGHHGSKTSSSKEFINDINPKYSIISVGKNNRYGHPNKEVLENLKDSNIYRTDKDGSIMFKIKNNKLKIETCAP